MRPTFGRIAAKPLPKHRKDPFAESAKFNFDREERAAIHEFDGGCTRAVADQLAAAECQHCGHVLQLEPVHKASYGHGLDVCAACAASLVTKGWARGKEYVEGKVW